MVDFWNEFTPWWWFIAKLYCQYTKRNCVTIPNKKTTQKIIEWQFCWIKVYKIAKIFEGSSIISYKRNIGQRVNFFVFHRYFCTYALLIIYVYRARPRSDRKTKSKLFVVKILVLIVRIWGDPEQDAERETAREKIISFKCWYICFCFIVKKYYTINFVWCINNDRTHPGFYSHSSTNEKHIWSTEKLIAMYRKSRNLFNPI